MEEEQIEEESEEEDKIVLYARRNSRVRKRTK